MDTRKRIFMGFLVLTCLSLSSARRLLLDSYDPRMPQQSISDLAEGSGSQTGLCFGSGCGCGPGLGPNFECGGPDGGFGGGGDSGSGGSFECGQPDEGFGGGCGSGSGGSFECGRPDEGFGGGCGSRSGGSVGCGHPNEGFGGGCGSSSGGSFECGHPDEGFGGGCGLGSGGSFECGRPDEGFVGGCGSGSGGSPRSSECGFHRGHHRGGLGPWQPPLPTSGFETFPPPGSCSCPCYTYAAHELAERTGNPSVGTTRLVIPNLPGGSCPCSCDGYGVFSKCAAPVQPEFAARMVMTSAGSNIGVNSDPTSSNASKEDQEAHQATRGYGSSAFVTHDSEPAPVDGSAPERNQEDKKMMDGNTMAVDDTIT